MLLGNSRVGFDVKTLCDGRSVAVIKRKADWVTDIGISSTGIKSPQFMHMDYEDYMRLYLMMCDTGVIMTRFADIIQLNSLHGFDIADTYNGICIKADISFRSLTGRRHEETIEINIGYDGRYIG